MECVRQTMRATELAGFIDLPLSLRGSSVEIIVLPVMDKIDVEEKPNYKCNLGFWNGPELPESFFDPLPEEDLQAWGL